MNLLFNLSQQLILVKDLTGVLDFKEIDSELSSTEFTKNVGNQISVDKHFLDKNIFADGKAFIEEECKQFIDNTLHIKGLYEKIQITESWANKTQVGENHHEHLHPFSIISGVIFLDNNPSNLNLCIESYLPQIPYFITKNKTYASLYALIADQQIDPVSINNLQNHMVLFLSSLNHFVEEIPSGSPMRRTLSFNTFWSGKTGVGEDNLGSHTF